MAVGPVTLFDRALPKLTNGVMDMDSHTFKAMLLNNTQALTSAFAGGSTDCRKADLTGEFSTGGGYTAGGVALSSITLTRVGALVTWDAADLLWSTLTLANAQYLAVYDDTAANDDLLFFLELNVGGTISPAGVDVAVAWNAAGIFEYERV